MRFSHIKCAIVLTSCLVLSSCLGYIPKASHGNIYSQERVEKLQVGLSRDQVIDLMGPPMLQTFHEQSVWYYTSSKLSEHSWNWEHYDHIKLTFAQDKLAQIDRITPPQDLAYQTTDDEEQEPSTNDEEQEPSTNDEEQEPSTNDEEQEPSSQS